MLEWIGLSPKPMRGSSTERIATGERPSAEFWALKDVSFEIKRGEVIGLIGSNGAGKSTLLKLLSRITEPTSGRADIYGRVGSLLEVGTGFHHDLTGRENVFLNGAFLGMSQRDIRRCFDEIVAFAEIDGFIDTPVKRYSSGMYVRLAFSVAAHLESEILIVDEVLAVGDAAFQQKSLKKMQSLVNDDGRTVLLVTHNAAAMTSLCDKAIYLVDGQTGPVEDAVVSLRKYNNDTDGLVSELCHAWTGDVGDENLRLRRTSIQALEPGGRFSVSSDLEICLEVEILRPSKNVVMGFRLFSEYGHELAFVLYDDGALPPAPVLPPGKWNIRWTIPRYTLATGRYAIGFTLGVHMIKAVALNTAGSLRFSLSRASDYATRFVPSDRPGVTSIFRPMWRVTTQSSSRTTEEQ